MKTEIRNKIAYISLNNMIIEESDKLRVEAKHIINQGIYNFVIDMSECKFIDCTGLGILTMINRIVKDKKNGSVVLKGVGFEVYHILKTTRLNKVFDIELK